MGNKQHRAARLLPKANHLVLQVEAEFDVHLPIGFIHQQQIRVHGEGPADDNTLLGTHRQLVRIGVTKVLQAHQLNNVFHPLVDLFFGQLFQLQPKA